MATDQINTIYLGVTSRQMMTARIYKQVNSIKDMPDRDDTSCCAYLTTE